MIFNNIIKIVDCLGSRISFVGHLYIRIHRDVVRKEAEEAAISAKDNVLHIGCGSLPYTAEILHKKFWARIVAIDSDRRAVRKAREYVSKRELTEGIKIGWGDGLTYPLSGFSVIVMSLGVKPGDLVLERILSSVRPGTKIIFRYPRGIFGKMYNNNHSHLLAHLLRGKRITHKAINFRESVIFEK